METLIVSCQQLPPIQLLTETSLITLTDCFESLSATGLWLTKERGNTSHLSYRLSLIHQGNVIKRRKATATQKINVYLCALQVVIVGSAGRHLPSNEQSYRLLPTP